MPTIICSYCQYVGQGEDENAQYADVEFHEETCPENPDFEKAVEELALDLEEMLEQDPNWTKNENGTWSKDL